MFKMFSLPKIGSRTISRNPKRPRCRRAGRRTRNRQRIGGATVEMALVAPFVFTLIFGSVEFSRMMMVRQALTNAAREGSRHACLITTQDSDTCETVVRTFLKGVIVDSMNTDDIRIKSSPDFSTDPDSALPDSGTTITTQVEVDCADVSWLPAFFTAGAKIRGTSTMNRE